MLKVKWCNITLLNAIVIYPCVDFVSDWKCPVCVCLMGIRDRWAKEWESSWDGVQMYAKRKRKMPLDLPWMRCLERELQVSHWPDGRYRAMLGKTCASPWERHRGHWAGILKLLSGALVCLHLAAHSLRTGAKGISWILPYIRCCHPSLAESLLTGWIVSVQSFS